MKSFKQKTNVVEEQEEYKDDLTVLKEAGLLETSAMGEVPPEPEEPIGNHKVPPKPIEFIDEQVTKPVVLDPPKRPILSFESFSDGESTTTTEALIARNPEMSLEQVEDAIEEEIVSNEVEEVEIVEEPVLKIPTKKPTKVEIAFESALKDYSSILDINSVDIKSENDKIREKEQEAIAEITSVNDAFNAVEEIIIRELETPKEPEVYTAIQDAAEYITSRKDEKEPLSEVTAFRQELEKFKQVITEQVNQSTQWGQSSYGSGEVRFEFLDDVDRDSVKQDGYFLIFDR